jgi:hypothetical protein
MRDYREYPARFVEQMAPIKCWPGRGHFLWNKRDEGSDTLGSCRDRHSGDLRNSGLRFLCPLNDVGRPSTVLMSGQRINRTVAIALSLPWLSDYQ